MANFDRSFVLTMTTGGVALDGIAFDHIRFDTR